MRKKKEIEEALNLPLTKEEFISEVETLVRRDEMGYLEAIIYICEQNEYDPEDITTLINGPLKEKLKLEAVRNNVIKGKKSNTATLL